MGIETAAIITLAAASGYQAYQSKAAATDAKQAAKQQENKAKALRQEEERNRLQSVMRMLKRSGARSTDTTSLTSPLSGQTLGVGGGGKTLLGM